MILSNGVNESEANNELRIYPNPTKKTISIESSEFISSIMFVSPIGQVIAIGKFSLNRYSPTLQIDISAFAKGVYFLHLYTTQGNTMVRKVMKE